MKKTRQIPQPLPQFTGTPALLVVAGSMSAHIYYAHNGIVAEIDRAKSDFVFDEREGFFLSSHPRVGTIRSGAPDMVDKASERDRFLTKLAASITRLVRTQNIREVRIFVEEASAPLLMSKLPNDVRSRAWLERRRNLQFEHPVELFKHMIA